MRLIYNYRTYSMYIYNEVTEPEIPAFFPVDRDCLVYDISDWSTEDFSEFIQLAGSDQADSLKSVDSHDPKEIF